MEPEKLAKELESHIEIEEKAIKAYETAMGMIDHFAFGSFLRNS